MFVNYKTAPNSLEIFIYSMEYTKTNRFHHEAHVKLIHAQKLIMYTLIR